MLCWNLDVETEMISFLPTFVAHKDVLKNKSKFGATMEIYTIIWVMVYVCGDGATGATK